MRRSALSKPQSLNIPWWWSGNFLGLHATEVYEEGGAIHNVVFLIEMI